MNHRTPLLNFVPIAWLAACTCLSALPQGVAPAFMDPIPGSSSTRMPERLLDDYWNSEFVRVNREVSQAHGSQLVFFGDSITLRWSLAKAEGKEVWEKRFAKYKPINMGNSGDITPVMLYRVSHGNLDFPKGQEPRVAVLLCGTNNYVVKQSAGGKESWDLGIESPPAQVADGVRAVAQAFRQKLPTTRLILLGILPVKDPTKWEKCRETNRILANHTYPNDEVVFLDFAGRFLNPDGTQKAELFTDGTHLTTAGYQVMADAIAPQIEQWIKLTPIKSGQ